MKLKKYINEKPRIKKALKIITTTIVLFFAGFGVVCSGLLIGSCANQKRQELIATTPIVDKPPVKRGLDYDDDIYLYSLYEVFDLDVLFNLVIDYTNWGWLPNVGSTATMQLSNTYLVTFDNFDLFSGSLNLNDYTQLRSLWIEFYSSNTFGYNNGYRDNKYRFTFRNAGDGVALECYFSIVSPYSSVGAKPIYDGNMFFTVESGPTSVVNNIGILFYGSSDDFLREYVIIDESNGAYQRGFNAGYTAGYSAGYDVGYQYGYTAGDQSTVGLTSNPFDLIRKSFESIADFLNIQVLPNLTLGVLIFAPLIVTIIIVIIKMIRG